MKNEIEIENWKAVDDYEGLYEVSDLGRVKSLNYLGTGKAKMLKPRPNGHGYFYVTLSKNGKTKNFYVHRLVVTEFIGPIPKGLVVNHLNEDKSDNRLSNLEIVTVKQNLNHGTRNERAGKSISKALKGNTNGAKQLGIIEAEWPYRELTFPSSVKASEFFNYKAKETVSVLISCARQRGENWFNARGTKYYFSQQA